MSSTCQIIHYDASQYRVYIHVCNFAFVIPKSQWQGPRCVLFCTLYTGQCPQGTSLEVSLPPSQFFRRSSLAPLRCSLPLPLASPSLRLYLRSFLTRSLPPLSPHPPPHIIASSLPPLAPSLPTLPLLPPSHTPSFLAPSLPACFPPSNSMYTVLVCVFGKLHYIV